MSIMRFNDKELAHFGCSTTTDFEGRLNYRTPSGNFGQPVFKERWFKLKSNFLFYFRITELGAIDYKEPVGVFVLENFTVQKVDSRETPFAFSIIFQDDYEKKHYFSARSEELVNTWVNAINQCSYENMRSKLHTLQNLIKVASGVDQLQMHPYVDRSREINNQPGSSRPAKSGQSSKSASFKCHVSPFASPTTAPRHSDSSLFAPPSGNPTAPVRPSRSTDAQRNNSTGSPARIPFRKAPPPPVEQPEKDLIEF
ncbi:Hypothetical predicted protein [Cloeon dipterum]|uniref:Pleckstrin homology domain-containing family J member 1 n=1 Tax=Cloeon dipterum TaxID=197152 RepID=A0A8S1E0R0_9INSE|nr:Hypothetical predicted protein [Cloeon dipterum]